MSAIFHRIAPGVCAIERGWLNCNQIVLTSAGWNVLIDSGYGRHADATLGYVDEALQGGHLHWLLNTHCHSDHMGGNRSLRSHYQCRLTIPEGEVRHVVPWTQQSCWSELMDQYAEEFSFDDTMAAGDSFEAGGLRWLAYAAPGHDMDALMFYAKDAGILVSGDALWERGLGFVWPRPLGGDNPHIDAALATIDLIEKLAPAVVVPGHGAPFTGVSASIANGRGRLVALAADPQKNARHAAKALFVFALLDKGGMKMSAVPGYLESVPVYRQFRDDFLGGTNAELAERVVSELVAAKALAVDGEMLRPTMRA